MLVGYVKVSYFLSKPRQMLQLQCFSQTIRTDKLLDFVGLFDFKQLSFPKLSETNSQTKRRATATRGATATYLFYLSLIFIT
jgi:hypothetical protein